jgi:hypothetical protein
MEATVADVGNMRAMLTATTILALTVPAIAGQVPDKSFFNGNEVYQWCQHDRVVAQSYVGGMYDMAAHGAVAIDGMRHHGGMPSDDSEVEFALERVVGFCKPEGVTLEQMTDVFCVYLKDKSAERNGLPSIMFNDALKRAWPCRGN